MKNFYYLLIGIALTGLLACGGGANQENNADNASTSTSESGPANMQEAMNEVQNQIEKMQSGEAKEVVNFRELKKLLPEKLSNMNRTDASGETTGMFGMNVSHAEGVYRDEDTNKNLRINITDVAGMGAAMAGLASWSLVDFDKETDEGYERTTIINGNKAYEKYNTKNKSGEVAMVVDSRFVLTVAGSGVSMDDLKDALDAIDTGELSGL